MIDRQTDPKKDLIFAPPHFKKENIETSPPAIFCNGFCPTLRLAHLQVSFFLRRKKYAFKKLTSHHLQ